MTAATKFIVWDWNGTLLDDVDASHAGMNVVLERFKREPVDLDGFREIFDMPLLNLYMKAGFTESDVRRHMLQMQDTFHNYYEPAAAMAALRTGAKEILEPLKKKVEQIILSNHITDMIAAHLDRLELGSLFDIVLANDGRLVEVSAMTKGERLIAYMEEKELLPAQGLIVGDTPEEIHIGRSVGLSSVAVTGGYASQRRLEDAGPDYLIHALSELTPILEQRGFL